MFRHKTANVMETIGTAIESRMDGILDRRAPRGRAETRPWDGTPPELLMRRETSYATARTLGWNR